MTDEQINRAIAEACGWSMEDGVWVWTTDGIDCTYYELWDWANDLNAMQQAIRILNKDQFADFIWELMSLSHEPMLSTARQRAEAFLRTLGKWEEVQP